MLGVSPHRATKVVRGIRRGNQSTEDGHAAPSIANLVDKRVRAQAGNYPNLNPDTTHLISHLTELLIFQHATNGSNSHL